MDRFVTNVHPKVLSYDDYTAADNSTYPPNNYDLYWHYSTLKRFRYYAQSNKIPFWRIIESNLGNISPKTAGIFRFQIFTSLLDTNVPTAPASLQAMAQSPSEVRLAWEASADPQSGVTRYCICRDDVQVGTSTAPSFTNSGLQADTNYSYQVSAVNGEGLGVASSPIIILCQTTFYPNGLFSDGLEPRRGPL